MKTCKYTIESRNYLTKGKSKKMYDIVKHTKRGKNEYEESLSSHRNFSSANKKLKKLCG